MEVEAKERELALLRKSIDECRTKRDSLEHRIHSLESLIDDRCKSLDDTENQIGCMKRELASYCREIDAKEREYHSIRRSVEERRMELEAMEEALKSVKNQIGERERDLRLKEEDCNWKLEMMDQLIGERGEIHKKMERGVEACGADLVAKESRLSVVVGLIRERERELQEKRVELRDMNRECEWKEKELGEFSVRIDECNKEIRAKEEELDSVRRLIDGEREELEIKRRDLMKEIELNKKEIRAKEEELDSVRKLIDGEREELEIKRRDLMKEIELNKKEFDSFGRSMREMTEELEKRERKHGESVKDFELMKNQFEGRVKEFESKEKEYGGREKELKAKERKFEERVREFELKVKQFEVIVEKFESKEKQLEGQLQELESKQKKFKEQVKEFESEQKRFTIQEMVHKSKEKKLEVQQKMLESKEKQYDAQVQELKAKEEQFEVRAKELESKEKEFEGQVKDLESQQNQYAGQMKAIELRKEMLNKQRNQYEEKLKELNSREKQIEDQYEEHVKELELKEAQFKLALKTLESEENQFEGRLKDLQSKQNQLGRQQKELELKEKQCESLRKSFEEGQLLKEKSNILLHQVKAEPLDFSDANSVSMPKNLQLLFNLLKNYVLVCNQVSDALQASADPGIVVLDTLKCSCPPQLRQELTECDANFSRRVRNLLISELMKSSPVISSLAKQEAIKFASDWKENISVPNADRLEILDFLKFVATYEIGSSCNEHELQRLLDIILHHCQSPQTLCDTEKLPDNQTSPTTYDGRNLQFLSDEPELIGNDILACLQTSSDPATLVLDIIQNPIVPQDRKGNEGIIIDESHIILLDQLMRISPSPIIKPHIRDGAKKLAVALKAHMNPSDENSLVVLGFLLLLSIYGLVSYFNEDEVFKLLEFAAQHKQAIELFRTLGFADKIAVFVQNLVDKKQYVDAARFICAYKLAYKINPIDLLRFEISKAEGISKKIGRQKPIEQKVRCKELELGILRKVRQCISDNNLESQDLVSKVERRIVLQERKKEALIVLAKQKEELGHLVSKLSSALEVHQPEEKKCASREFSENQVHQPEDKISADSSVSENQVKEQQPKEKENSNGAVSENQVKVQQPIENKSANGAVTENHVKVQQAKAKKSAKGAVTMNQVQGQQPEENISTNEAVTMNQVPVQQPQEKKRPIEAVPNDYQLQQSGLDNKRPRTGASATFSLPPRVFTPHYQHTFCPRGMPAMPAQFVLPPNYYGVTGGAGYFCHPRPYPRFR